ncbi:2-hydroxycarboxylate transporter family protein [Bordetella sp. N]|uniref:2-hydroxycarboxylate transporter family protein n=1 Tax=Bordetella sp. N TaxID=1746199 RepID=UPI001E399B0A|nr:2-hydroxycarboxylate transporter family protein [Bordetella sp. N]
MSWRIGIIPVPLFVMMVVVLTVLYALRKVPGDIVTAIMLLPVGGFACAELGKRTPFVRKFGGASIFATFIPSALVYYGVLPNEFTNAVTSWTKQSNFLYLCIATIIVGSILGMNRRVLIQGFLRVVVPLGIGSVCAAIVGTLVGTLLGIGAWKTFFFIVVPIMAGGVGEGAIPLSIGYAAVLGHEQGLLFAQVLPAVMLGSLSAILMSGLLDSVGKRYPSLTGNGKLVKLEAGAPISGESVVMTQASASGPIEVATVGVATMLAVCLYMVGYVVQQLYHFPAPVLMLLFAVLLKVGRLLPPDMENGAYRVYRFFATCVNYPLLFAVGVALTPWQELIGAFTVPNLITIAATVATLMASGFVTARWLNMYPVEAAVVNACHSGQGSTGDLAILTAANRLELMPFAQVATRIGGAITVTLALIALRWWS